MTDDIQPMPADRGRMPRFEPDADHARPDYLLEAELRSALRLVFLLVQRLGGEVELSDDELISVDPAWELLTRTDPMTNTMIVKCRKPSKERK